MTVERFKRFERKIPIDVEAVDHAAAFLGGNLEWDRDYPEGLIAGVYFDDARLSAYQDTLDGELRRHKVRLRWYGDAEPSGDMDVFVEIKEKHGFSCDKRRVKRRLAGGGLRGPGLGGIAAAVDLNGAMLELGPLDASFLRPVVRISYRRRRFLDPLTGARVTLDDKITSRIVDDGLASFGGDLSLSSAVIEIKGAGLALPPTLRRLSGLGPVWSSFSKYAVCLSTQIEPPGQQWIQYN